MSSADPAAVHGDSATLRLCNHCHCNDHDHDHYPSYAYCPLLLHPPISRARGRPVEAQLRVESRQSPVESRALRAES